MDTPWNRPLEYSLEMQELHRKFKTQLDELIKQRNIQEENLTREQLGDAIEQAIKCGDFIRLVSGGIGTAEKSAVIYMPFAREQELLARIKELEDQINNSNDDETYFKL